MAVLSDHIRRWKVKSCRLYRDENWFPPRNLGQRALITILITLWVGVFTVPPSPRAISHLTLIADCMLNNTLLLATPSVLSVLVVVTATATVAIILHPPACKPNRKVATSPCLGIVDCKSATINFSWFVWRAWCGKWGGRARGGYFKINISGKRDQRFHAFFFFFTKHDSLLSFLECRSVGRQVVQVSR